MRRFETGEMGARELGGSGDRRFESGRTIGQQALVKFGSAEIGRHERSKGCLEGFWGALLIKSETDSRATIPYLYVLVTVSIEVASERRRRDGGRVGLVIQSPERRSVVSSHRP